MSVARKIFLNTSWQVVLRLLEVALGVVILGLITRLLGQDNYGYFTTVTAWVQLFFTVADFGLYLTLLRELGAKPSGEHSSIVNSIFTLRLITALIMLGLCVVAVQLTNYPDAIKAGVWALSWSYFFVSLTSVLTAVFQRELAMPKIAWANVINKIIYFGLLVYIAGWLNHSLQAVLWASSLASALYFILTVILLRPYVMLAWQIDLSYWLKVLKKTWPLAITIALNLIYFKLDTIFLSWFEPSASVGLYGAAYRVLEMLTTFPHMFMGLIFPIMTAAWVAGNLIELQKLWQRAFDFFALLTLPLIAGAIVVGRPLMSLVAGPDFEAAGDILKILMLATAIIFFGTLYTYLVLIFDKQKTMIPYFALTAIISVIGYWWLIPLYSYWAAAWVTVAVELLIVIFAWIIVRKQLAYQPDLSVLFKSALASLLMAGFIWLLPEMSVLIKITLAAGIYFIFIIFFRAVRISELKHLTNKN